MTKKYNKLVQFLNYYYTECQKNILLVYRGELTENWAKRTTYLGNEYYPKLNYNHRSILDCEVVFEYDYEDTELNKKLVDKIATRLSADGIEWAKWSSGNKSIHLHILINNSKVMNLSLFKNAILRFYGTYYYNEVTKVISDTEVDGYKKLVPDLKLATPNHLIRAEYGIHEKTQKKKSLISKTLDYPCKSNIPLIVFEEYTKAQEKSVRQRIMQTTSELADSELVKKLLDTVYFRNDMDDGRERVMYQLIHILKPKFKSKPTGQEELVNFLWEWYKYSSSQGLKMTEVDVRNKVRYHWNKDYTITEATLKRTIEDIGGK